MSIPALSTVPEVRDDLVTRIRGYLVSAGITDTRVSYGEPDGDPSAKYIAVCGLSPGSQTDSDSKRVPRADVKVDERYTLDIVFGAEARGQDSNEAAQAVYEAAWANVRLVAKQLRSSTAEQTLGGLVSYAVFSSFKDAEWWSADGRMALVVGHLNVNAVHI